MRVETAEFIRSAHGSGDFLRDGRPEIVFVGRSNVGKSSLMNRLLGRKGLARTSSTPGRTRAVNYFLVNRRFYFVDLPGYGYAKAGKDERREWAALVDGYIRDVLERALVVMLVDGKVGATALDAQAYEYLSSLGADLVVAPTKIDRVPRGKRAGMQRGIREELKLDESVRLLPVSSESGEGIKELWGVVTSHLEGIVRKGER
ncbi:MAG TPA: ribosome biogenesis GTP-binding protein YihA/YsxC [Thermoanaerobaculia bacterium]|nr:ribosome biogenesis GTP-binding protein YihA/YsxC [Thermoanaerobaculia bacterium]